MRIVHEINLPMQIGGGGSRYMAAKGKKPKPGAGRVELIATEDCPGNHPKRMRRQFDILSVGETIHIEGDAEHVEKMLEDLLRVTKSVRKLWK